MELLAVTVWIVVSLYDYEGYSIHGIYANKSDAKLVKDTLEITKWLFDEFNIYTADVILVADGYHLFPWEVSE